MALIITYQPHTHIFACTHTPCHEMRPYYTCAVHSTQLPILQIKDTCTYSIHIYLCKDI